MEHLLLKAATTVASDQGTFTAVISAATIDREKDIVDPAGMVRALQKWIPTGKNIPLAWNHSTKAEDQIGYVDPKSARVEGGEVVVDGWIDQSTEVGAHAWRLVKAGTLGFSFGYLTLDSSPRKGGGRHLKELDVFEITASNTPMNNDTRVVGWKAAGGDRGARILNSMLGQAQEFIAAEPDGADIAQMRKIADALKALGAEEADEPPDGDEGKSLRERADAIALELAAGGSPPEKAPESAQEPEPDHAKALLDLFPEDEAQAAIAGELKSVWTAGYLADLPDSAFLHVEEAKDAEKAVRLFAFKHADGSIDLPHLRRALTRIPEAPLTQDVKDRLLLRAARLLDAKSVDGTAQAPGRAVDPLRAQAEALALEIASGGMSLEKPPQPAKKAPPPNLIPLDELRERSRIEMLTALSGLDIEA